MKRDRVSVAIFSTVFVIGTLTIIGAMQTFLLGKFDPKNAPKAQRIRLEYAAKLIQGADDSLRAMPSSDPELEAVRLSLQSARETLTRKIPPGSR